MGDRLTVSMCGRITIPFSTSRRTQLEVVKCLPADLGPEAIGLSHELVRKKLAEESLEVR